MTALLFGLPASSARKRAGRLRLGPSCCLCFERCKIFTLPVRSVSHLFEVLLASGILATGGVPYRPSALRDHVPAAGSPPMLLCNRVDRLFILRPCSVLFVCQTASRNRYMYCRCSVPGSYTTLSLPTSNRSPRSHILYSIRTIRWAMAMTARR